MASKTARNHVPTDQEIVDRLGRDWEGVGSGKVEKWEEGKEVVGVLVRVKEGSLERADKSHAKLVLIAEAAGQVRTFGCPAILESKLEGFEPGDGIYIRCMGKVQTAGTKKFGNAAWDFMVYRKRAQRSLPI